MFPVNRPRRLRTSQTIRDLVSESSIDPRKLIMPVFADETTEKPKPVKSMPGISRYPVNGLSIHLDELESSGVNGVLFFGIPSSKNETGSSAFDQDGVVQRSIRIAKENTGLTVVADLCMCEYTSHGHCGILKGQYVDNDETLKVYQKIALSYASSGADIIAPSGMMDGQVAAIREVLDNNGYENLPVMAYSAKYASTMYGPFRDAAESTPSFGDRKTYQMDARNSREAMREIELDLAEGAEIIMVKPALFYLDVIRMARERFDHPIAAYSVSGEYSMIKNAVDNGFLSEGAIIESINSIFRAGADIVITYFAKYLAEKLNS
ncbi:MAG: porphobilinogen synthase [Candidatus Thermoplasmatota archaeon]|nr:porphobilinogen synthase [Candidatus Thermoplasmatota archaeon]MCL6089815.1 porphobilinogen synthase [Candidatus Thermoplasmatota archaeon]MDA8143413.1 porphobilinogen synthase [Thermoplasmatales archaeon]